MRTSSFCARLSAANESTDAPSEVRPQRPRSAAACPLPTRRPPGAVSAPCELNDEQRRRLCRGRMQFVRLARSTQQSPRTQPVAPAPRRDKPETASAPSALRDSGTRNVPGGPKQQRRTLQWIGWASELDIVSARDATHLAGSVVGHLGDLREHGGCQATRRSRRAVELSKRIIALEMPSQCETGA